MTAALCLHCGEIKFGAICQCPVCGGGSTGDIGIDVAFSDHRIGRRSLESFGALIKQLRAAAQDDDLSACAFLWYISENHPEILTVTFPSEVLERVQRFVEGLSLPKIAIESAEDAWRAEQRLQPQRLIDTLLHFAIRAGASTLELVPGPDGGRLWVRGDAAAFDAPPPPASLLPDLIGELARLADIDRPASSSFSEGCFTIPSTFAKSFDPDQPRSVRVAVAADRFQITITRLDDRTEEDASITNPATASLAALQASRRPRQF